MGVMSCSRECCHSIMCDTYIDGIGYICTDCQEEFKQFLFDCNLSPKRENEIEKALKIFIETNKGDYKENREVNVDAFFKERTSN